MKAVGKNDVLMWHVFYRLIFYVPCVFHPDKIWRKLKNFEWEGSRNAEPFFFPHFYCYFKSQLHPNFLPHKRQKTRSHLPLFISIILCGYTLLGY